MINPNQFGYKAGYYHYCLHLKDMGCKITYLCRFQDLPLIELPGVDVVYVYGKSSTVWRREAMRRLEEIIERGFVQIILCSYFKGCSVFVKHFGNVPAIMDIRSGDVTPNRIKRGLYNWLIKKEASKFSRTMILSQLLADKLKLEKGSYDIVPLGADVISSSAKKYDDFRLLYVGTLQQRNIHMTIEGVSLFKKKHPDCKIKYDIIGFGTDEDENLIAETIKDANLTDYVTFHGRINYKYLQPYFDDANIGVAFVPQTPYYDCQPSTKIYEYVLSGLFCLATNTYENKLSITSENGILHDDDALSFCNALEEFYKKNKAEITTERIKNTMTEYLWSNIVGAKLLPLLRKVK